MKPRRTKRGNHALTLLDVVVVIFVMALSVLFLLPMLAAATKKTNRLGCTNNLKQIGLAVKVWAGDNSDKYPMEVAGTNGGVMELMETTDAWKTYQVMSNELSTPRVIICPEDSLRTSAATNFGEDLKNKISYFIGCDAATSNVPTLLISGDDNFEINGSAVKVGLLSLSATTPPSWSAARHRHAGNLLLNDGSVQSTTSSMLQNYWRQTGIATNRIVIP